MLRALICFVEDPRITMGYNMLKTYSIKKIRFLVALQRAKKFINFYTGQLLQRFSAYFNVIDIKLLQTFLVVTYLKHTV